ncbi:DUF4041 domain-containing protein [Facklamia sp. DSM 111018]|uniref:DUF4041 domain-containing protein n=1 Tax=Facklamia lactis TaxID=2749967 RepID=A0ABS0LT21_9LACT|nr:DUF4041 domain-containing protein [Facklamia lactis]MBG9987305.1 DUF4041 domain-containing protein [Facklamia lactis]
MRGLKRGVLIALWIFTLLSSLSLFKTHDFVSSIFTVLLIFYVGYHYLLKDKKKVNQKSFIGKLKPLIRTKKEKNIIKTEIEINESQSDNSKNGVITKFREQKIDSDIKIKKQILKELKQKIKEANDELEFIEYGLYQRKYKFSDSTTYKLALENIRLKEKVLIKNDQAGIILNPMMLNNSASKGKTMQKQLIKAMIRGFNGEADALLTKISVANSERKVASLERIFEQINKLYKRNEIEISKKYLEYKKEELQLAAEYELMKQEEKEALREQRKKEREDKKLQEEIKKKRQQLEKDRTHYKQMIDSVEEMIKKASESEINALKAQLVEYQDKISELDEIEEDIDYREGHASAGYVYVISNIGSFGKDIYKIGVTRRLEPLERIAELSSASVPFRFDVHALVFSENAF